MLQTDDDFTGGGAAVTPCLCGAGGCATPDALLLRDALAATARRVNDLNRASFERYCADRDAGRTPAEPWAYRLAVLAERYAEMGD